MFIGIGLSLTRSGRIGPYIALSSTTVAEDATNGAAIGTLSVVNGTGTYTFTVTDDPDEVFTVDSDDLEKDGTLDYETATSHQVTIRADNGAGSVLTKTFTITIIDVVEPRLLLESGDIALLENGDKILLEAA